MQLATLLLPVLVVANSFLALKENIIIFHFQVKIVLTHVLAHEELEHNLMLSGKKCFVLVMFLNVQDELSCYVFLKTKKA